MRLLARGCNREVCCCDMQVCRLKSANLQVSRCGRVQTRYGGLSRPFGEVVKISQPVGVTPMVCSNCADSERSRVTAVQPSDRIFTCAFPRLIIGSMVNSMPGLSGRPS